MMPFYENFKFKFYAHMFQNTSSQLLMKIARYMQRLAGCVTYVSNCFLLTAKLVASVSHQLSSIFLENGKIIKLSWIFHTTDVRLYMENENSTPRCTQ